MKSCTEKCEVPGLRAEVERLTKEREQFGDSERAARTEVERLRAEVERQREALVEFIDAHQVDAAGLLWCEPADAAVARAALAGKETS